MRRLLIFPILMPLLGLPCIALATYLVSGQPKDIRFEGFLHGVTYSYRFVAIPACISAVVDMFLTISLARMPRALAMLGIGYVTTFIWLCMLNLLTLHAVYYAALMGLVGTVPAAVCSWLSDQT